MFSKKTNKALIWNFYCEPMGPNCDNVAGDFKMITFGQAPNTVHISYRGTDHRIHEIYWASPCQNTNPTCDAHQLMRTTSSTIPKAMPSGTHINPFVQPNPTNDKFTILMDMEKNENIHCTITNTEGKVVAEREIREIQDCRFSLENQASGLYFIHLQSNKKNTTLKLQKL